jgi:hypothetical protein
MAAPRAKVVWVIFDPLDGPHLFRSKNEAWKTYRQWEKEAEKADFEDSFWDMSEPTEYKRTDE